MPLLTPHWAASEWTRYETYSQDCVVPLWCEGPDLASITPLPLRRFQALDLRRPRRRQWRELARCLRELLRRPASDKAARLAHVPFAPNPHFVGREQRLVDIHEKLHVAPAVALTHARPFVLAGLGGIGKTTLAREYAERFWRHYRQVLWVSAAQAEALPLEFARLALEMGLVSRPSADASLDALLAGEELASDVDRLLIIDNAVDEEAVQAWIPRTGRCRTLITSRFTAWSPEVESVHVYVLDPEPARELLLRSGGMEPTPENLAAGDELAAALGYLPLALEQAAAFVREARVSLPRYLGLFAQSQTALLDRRTPGGDQYPDSVLTTWRLTAARLPSVGQGHAVPGRVPGGREPAARRGRGGGGRPERSGPRTGGVAGRRPRGGRSRVRGRGAGRA